MNRVKALWDQLGAKLGVVLCLGGFVALYLGWNGAASFDDVPAQFPYLISGGLAGVCLVVIGAAMIIVETNREGREEIQATLVELRQALELLGRASSDGHGAGLLLGGATGMVVAGSSSYHRPDCHLVEGRDDAPVVPIEQAESDGLSACRICKPEPEPARRRQLRSS